MNSWTADEGDMPYDQHASADHDPDHGCTECGYREGEHAEDCSYKRVILDGWIRDEERYLKAHKADLKATYGARRAPTGAA